MTQIVRPIVYIGIIFLGIILRKVGMFGADSHKTMSKILMNITLPLTIVNVFVGFKPDPSMYFIVLLGLVFGLIPLFVSFFLFKKSSKEFRAFGMINSAGGNIGSFVLPLIQIFYGAEGAVICSLFDIGNALVMAGGSYALTVSMLHMEGENQNIGEMLKGFAKKLFTSVSFDAYLLMLILMVLNIRIPDIFGAITQPFANANPFVAMMMIGLMFKWQKDKSRTKLMLSSMLVKYAIGFICCMIVYFILPFSPTIKAVMIFALAAPVGTLASVYSEKIEESYSETSSCLNSITVLISFAILMFLGFVVFK